MRATKNQIAWLGIQAALMVLTLFGFWFVAEKQRWEKAAADARETVADYVRKAVRQRVQAREVSPWEKHIGSADVAVPPPTNVNIRRDFAQPRRSKR
jgi:hypothetical protein